MREKREFLLHVCCAPCFAAAQASLAEGGGDGQVAPILAGIFFYNPNIHPLLEFRRRVKALQVYLERDRLTAEIDGTYGLQIYLDRVASGAVNRQERCSRCYRLRLAETARKACKEGLSFFSTTLLASREQDRDLVIAVGREIGKEQGVEFLVEDWRKILPDEKKMRGIYKQQYCGCIFSEEERYRNTNKHLY